MHKIVFYPVGNGDTSQIVIDNGKRFLFDFRHLRKAENGDGPEINLQKTLRDELKNAEKDYFDVVAFTHNDKDHIENSTDFFELLHADKYQGGDRIKIKELWVPAAMIIETAANDEQSDEFVIWRQEARHRLKKGKGIRVFSRPDKLKDWLEGEGIKLEDRMSLITDAGQIVPSYSLEGDGIEFFCHSPFVKHVDNGEDVLSNEASLIFNVRFRDGDKTFDYLAVGDSTWDVLEDIVGITKYHKNDDRLAWDIFSVPHHCSYLALSDDKGDRETTPKPKVKELLLAGKEGAYIVSSSVPISDAKEDYDKTQPPHIQAKNCYKSYLRKIGGARFMVTMEEPNQRKPAPMVFEVTNFGVACAKTAVPATAASLLTLMPAPRAG